MFCSWGEETRKKLFLCRKLAIAESSILSALPCSRQSAAYAGSSVALSVELCWWANYPGGGEMGTVIQQC